MNKKSYDKPNDYFWYSPRGLPSGNRCVLIGETKSQIRDAISSFKVYQPTSRIQVPAYANISPLEAEIIVKTRNKSVHCGESVIINVVPNVVQLLVHPEDYWDLTTYLSNYEQTRHGDLYHLPTKKIQWLLPKHIIGEAILNLLNDRVRESAEKYFARLNKTDVYSSRLN